MKVLVQLLKHLKKTNSTLQKINLEQNGIGDEGASAIAEALKIKFNSSKN